jgi:purine-binding chemotaxis protein CheW
MSDITSQQLVVFSLGARSTRSRSAPSTRSSASPSPRRRVRRRLDPRRDRPARQDHPDLRPRRPHGLANLTAEPGKIVIVETGSDQVGVIVDEVDEVITVTTDMLEDVPTASRDTIEAIAKVDDRLVILLNPEGLFARQGEAADDAVAA